MSAYNAEKYISEAVESILNQTFQDFELIIADDGSKDQTRSIIDTYRGYKQVKISHNATNQGKTATINRLFQQVNGMYLTIHDADDISVVTRFEKQVNFLDQHPDHAICGSGFITINEQGQEWDRTLMNETHEEIIEKMCLTSQVHGPTAVLRLSAVEKLDMIYRPYFENNYEDIDFLYRILTMHKASNLADYLYKYRVLPDSLCRKNVTIKNRNLYPVVVYLYRQRAERGQDDLQVGRVDLVDDYLNQITKKYRQDHTLIHREAAAYYMYWKLYPQAIASAWKAVIKQPWKFDNFRTWQYCVRKSLFG